VKATKVAVNWTATRVAIGAGAEQDMLVGGSSSAHWVYNRNFDCFAEEGMWDRTSYRLCDGVVALTVKAVYGETLSSHCE